jgi:hypothetical protein
MIPNYKDIVDLLKKGATVEAQEKIMELREAVLELQEENAVLKARTKELQDRLNIQGSLEFSEGIYWMWNEDDAGDLSDKDGPFCQLCYDNDEKLIRLQPYTSFGVRGERLSSGYRCLKCSHYYKTGP